MRVRAGAGWYVVLRTSTRPRKRTQPSPNHPPTHPTQQAFTPVITMLCLFAFGLETPTNQMVMSVVIIAAGAVGGGGRMWDSARAGSKHTRTCV
jgi:hypothetical protein